MTETHAAMCILSYFCGATSVIAGWMYIDQVHSYMPPLVVSVICVIGVILLGSTL